MHAKPAVILDVTAASDGGGSLPNKQWLEKEKQAEHELHMAEIRNSTWLERWSIVPRFLSQIVAPVVGKLIWIAVVLVVPFHLLAPPDWRWLSSDWIYTLIPLVFRLFGQGGASGGTGAGAL